MVTQEQIDRHERVLASFGRRFQRGLTPLFADLLDQLAANPNLSRVEIARLFQPISNYAARQSLDLNALLESQALLLSDLPSATPSNLQRLREELTASVQSAVQQEQSNYIEALVLGAIAGAATVGTVRELRRTATKSRNRLVTAFDLNLRRFDSALMFVKADQAGVERFRYVGGTIPTTRSFCRKHVGAIYTKQKIQQIWRNQSWGGKAPGDPFVVRGGYNCRHFWVPVVEEE